MRILHFSDPHFSYITFDPKQFLSKQWLGNFNLALFRRNRYQTHHLDKIPQLASQLQVDVVLLTGDMTSTSQIIEFEMARDFVQLFEQPIYVLPGNHDMYTKHAEKHKVFYSFFPSDLMQATWIEKHRLTEGWWWVGLDCARANNLLKSNGVFRAKMDQHLEGVLNSIPEKDSIIIGNHFPLYTRSRPAHDTERASVLQDILRLIQMLSFIYMVTTTKLTSMTDNTKDILLS